MAGLDAFVVELDAAEEPAPAGAWAAIFHEEVGAVFVGGASAGTGPVVMGDDVAEGDLVDVGDVGGEAGGFVDGEGEVVAFVLTHFDADGVVVAGAVEVGVFALFAAGEVLDGDVVLDGEVPGEVADAVAAFASGGAEGAAFEGEGVVVGVAGVVLGAVDGDVAGLHGPEPGAADGAGADEVGAEVDLAEELVRGDGAEEFVVVAGLPGGGGGA